MADRRGATRQGDQTAVVEGPRDQLYVQAAENHVPVTVLHRSPQRKRPRFVFTSKRSYVLNVFHGLWNFQTKQTRQFPEPDALFSPPQNSYN